MWVLIQIFSLMIDKGASTSYLIAAYLDNEKLGKKKMATYKDIRQS